MPKWIFLDFKSQPKLLEIQSNLVWEKETDSLEEQIPTASWREGIYHVYRRLLQALSFIGLPTDAKGLDRFLNNDRYDVFSFGRPPTAIDIITAIQWLKPKKPPEGKKRRQGCWD